VFHGPNGSIPKGICVRLGEHGELSTCFNPQTLRYEALWRDGFLRFSDVRHGFLDGLLPAGEALPPRADGSPAEAADSLAYHGYYRFGPRVVFAYRVGATEYLDAPWQEGGEFRREVAPVDSHSLKAALQGGPKQWPQQIRVDGTMGQGSPYALDTIPLPIANPWRMPIFCGDHAFLSDGSVLICTMHGDVWKSSPLDGSLKGIVWTRFASGLHQPLGMLVEDDQIYVMGRDQLTRLHDLNDDGEADFYECVSNKVETSPSGHDYVCGLERDAQGNFYAASSNQGVIRIDAASGEATSLARGLRNPDGIHLTADGALTVPASEGEWTPASMICLVPPSKVALPATEPIHFGYGGPRHGETPTLPLIYLPRGVDNSSGSQATVPDDRWGPLQGKMIHLSFGAANHFLLLRDRVGDQEQGAVVPLAGDFNSGVHRAKFNPRDGQLYVSGMNGWGSYAAEDGCLQRVRYTGARVQLPTEFHVHENGVLVRFAQPVDPAVVAQAERHFAQAWNYRYSGGYGSPEFSTQLENVVGHDRLAVVPHVLDERAVFFEIPELQRVNTLQLSMGVDAQTPCQMFVTVHETDVPFTEFVGYAPTRKTKRPHPIVGDLAAATPPSPNPWAAPIDGARSIELQTGHGLSFAPNVIEAAPGEALQITLKNGDVVPHNWVLVDAGSLAEVGASADKLISTPDAARESYVPRGEEVIAHTNVVNPGTEFAIYFHAPQAPGSYPFICTFPGHWKAMQGTLIVK
jgi:azurin